jgi:hypothetical protein
MIQTEEVVLHHRSLFVMMSIHGSLTSAWSLAFLSALLYSKYSVPSRIHFSLIVQSDLSEPVDVYSDWIDACESANQ